MPRDLALAIETSNPSAYEGTGPGPGVALGVLVNGALSPLGVESIPADRPHDDDLVPAIDRLFAQHGRRPADLDRVIVSTGPGGFTALRIAVAAAKMICEATGAACVGVPSAEVVALRVREARGAFAVALSSKGRSAFVTRFAAPHAPDGPGTLAEAENLERLGIALLIADRFLPDPMRERCATLGIEVRTPVFDPAACLEAGAARAPVDPVSLLPFYPRLPEAVVKWRELHPERG
jgi:tRNA threonylcarbamoyl adenosine modification protein YeaZ